MSTKKCVIVIPVHKAEPSRYELTSFEQCYRVLGNHDIFVVAPDNMDLGAYQKVIPRLAVKRVDPVWLSSLLNYNKLKLSQYFYNLFSNYQYLLTYELDAFIFNDNVAYWCNRGYDYIGAPWFQGWDVPGAIPGEKLAAVGNSGFSIRNISAMKKGLRAIYYNDPSQADKQNPNRYIRKAKKLMGYIVNQFSAENSTLQNAGLLNEDWIISELMAKKANALKLPPVTEATKFSFEVKPETLFKMNNYHLPMGCHAWWRYNLTFWKPYIENFGYKL